MKLILILGFALLFTSCHKEESTLYYAYLKNTTSHKVEIRPFFSGSIPADKVITLLANETKEIANGMDRGIGNQGFSSSYFGGPNDSVVVLFDNLYSITHYFNTPTTLNSKYYLFTSLRNIGNPKSYLLEKRDISKYQRENKFTFEFKEQDYLDAR